MDPEFIKDAIKLWKEERIEEAIKEKEKKIKEKNKKLEEIDRKIERLVKYLNQDGKTPKEISSISKIPLKEINEILTK